MIKELLFVGDHMEADLMRKPLMRAGIELHRVSTVKAAQEFLARPGTVQANLAVVVQSSLALISNDDVNKPQSVDLLKLFDNVETYQRRETFVQHARQTGLLPASIPVFLATLDPPEMTPAGFTGTVQLTDELADYEKLIAQVKRSPRRGDETRPRR